MTTSTQPDGDAAAERTEQPIDFRALFDATPGLHLVLAPDSPRFTMLAASDALLREAMATREQCLGQSLFEVFPDTNPENAERSGVSNVRASLEAVLRTRARDQMPLQRYDLQRPDGSWLVRHWRPLNVPVLGADGAVRHILHYVQDATAEVLGAEALARAEQRGEAALEASDARYRSLFESIDEGFCVIEMLFDGDGQPVDYRFLEANPAFIAQTGLTDAIGRTMRELAPTHESHWFRIYGAVARTGEPARFDAPAEALGRWYDVFAFRVGRPGDHRVAVLFNDVSPRKRAEAERESLLATAQSARAEAEAAQARAESANRAKSEFLAVMSHELRTPLNAIGGYAELMEMGIRGAVTDQQRDDLARIQRSQRHLLGLINEVLNYARVETGTVRYDMRPVRVAGALDEAEALIAPQAREKHLTLVVAHCPPELTVRADAEKLRQILVNLLSNALKFTTTGGRVELTCGEDDGDDARIWIAVRDTGIGIHPAQLERIFEPFVQVRADLTRPHDGVGLGLAISRDLARGMGGDLTVESALGGGSVFRVVLGKA